MQVADLWWHLANGRWIGEHGAVPVKDPFSFTAYGHRWINDAWLSDLIFYAWTSFAGLYSLSWWKWTMAGAIFLVLMTALYRKTGDWFASYASSLFTLAVAAPFLDLRPHLYSFLAFVVLLHASLGRKVLPFWLPLLFLVWVNLHPFVFFGLFCLTLVIVFQFPKATGSERRRNILLLSASAAALFLTPNGVHSLLRSLRYAQTTTLYSVLLNDWRPPFEPGGIVSYLFPYSMALFVVTALLTLFRFRRTKTLPESVLIVVLGSITLVMSLKSRRFIPFFAITQAFLTADALAPYLLKLPFRRTVVPPIVACLLGVVLLAPFPIDSYAFAYLVGEDYVPVETCNFIESNNVSGNVFAEYGMAAYVMYRTHGRMKVFVDGRSDMVYSDDIFRRYMAVADNQGMWTDVVERSGAEYVLWPKNEGGTLQKLVATGRWKYLYDDAVSVLLVRSENMPAKTTPTPESSWKYIAAGDRYFRNGDAAASEPYFARALEMMPYSETACYALAASRQGLGKEDISKKTLAYCYSIYPPAWRDLPFGRAYERRQ